MWGTTSTSGSGTVHYGSTVGSYTDSVASININGIHTATITGLSAGQMLYYYIEADGDTVGQNDSDYSFKTAPNEDASFRLVAYGDTRNAPGAHSLVVGAIETYSPDIVIHTADITGDAQMEEYDPQFFQPAAPLLRHTPMFMSIGNHEYSPIRNYYQLYDLPTNNPSGTEAYYSFDYGPAHFVCLNTEFLPGGHESDPNKAAAQEAWLHADLIANTKPWTVAYFHRPPFGSGGHRGWESARAALVPIFEQYDVTIVFCGHNHLYDAYRVNGVYYITTGGGGAPPARATYDPPHQIYQDPLFPHLHFCVIDISTDSLLMQAVDQDGTFHAVAAPGHYLWARERNGIAGLVTVEPDELAYDTGREVTLTASPGTGFGFRYWEIHDPNHLHDANYATFDSNNPLTIVMDADRSVVAVHGCGGGAYLDLMVLALFLFAIVGALRKR
jgi:hypothetical protein